MLLGIYINVFFQITEGSSPERETLYFVEVNRCSTTKKFLECSHNQLNLLVILGQDGENMLTPGQLAKNFLGGGGPRKQFSVDSTGIRLLASVHFSSLEKFQGSDVDNCRLSVLFLYCLLCNRAGMYSKTSPQCSCTLRVSDSHDPVDTRLYLFQVT